MAKETPSALAQVAGYFSAKLAQHGDTALGADWNSAERQRRCFDQLAKVLDAPGAFSVNDLGCGYGALYEYLKDRFASFSYEGYDISEDMVRAARARHGDAPNARFTVSAEPLSVADYGIACGIFSVKLACDDKTWGAHVEKTLDALDRTSRRGFAFNSLTSYSDPGKMQDYLYYPDPCALFDLCKRRYARDVALLHDYGLYEFTILVRKER